MEREIYVRNQKGEWWIGSGRWSPDFSRALKFSDLYYARQDVGRHGFDPKGHELAEYLEPAAAGWQTAQ